MITSHIALAYLLPNSWWFGRLNSVELLVCILQVGYCSCLATRTTRPDLLYVIELDVLSSPDASLPRLMFLLQNGLGTSPRLRMVALSI